jgi:hypothetical protein
LEAVLRLRLPPSTDFDKAGSRRRSSIIGLDDRASVSAKNSLEAFSGAAGIAACGAHAPDVPIAREQNAVSQVEIRALIRFSDFSTASTAGHFNNINRMWALRPTDAHAPRQPGLDEAV